LNYLLKSPLIEREAGELVSYLLDVTLHSEISVSKSHHIDADDLDDRAVDRTLVVRRRKVSVLN